MSWSAAVVPWIVGAALLEPSLGDVVGISSSDALRGDVFSSAVSRTSIELDDKSQGSDRDWRDLVGSVDEAPDSRFELDDRRPLVVAC